MAISDTQKVDLLFKKIGFGVAKTDVATSKSPANETISSPLLIRGDSLWSQGGLITNVGTLPTSNSSVVTVYRDSLSSAAQTVNDGTASTNRTWKTGLTDWIGPEFGSGYAVKVYTGSALTASTVSTGTALPVDGSGNNDSWYFDYQSGVLNFADTNVPSSIAAQVWVVGARYTGLKGVTTFANMTIGNINITGNTISSSSGNVYISGNLTINGPAVSIGTSDLAIQDPILNLHTFANLAPLTYNDGYDIGLKFHYYDTVDSAAFLGRANDSGFLEWYSRGSDVANVFVGTVYGTIKTGGLILVNTNPATSTTTGAFQVAGGVGVAGNVFAGNVLTNNYLFANGTPLTNLTLSNVGAYLTTYTGNLSAGNISGNISTDSISPGVTPVTVFNSKTAIGLPVGNNSERPAASAGYFRFNSDSGTVEFYNGTSWIPFQNSISDQQIDPMVDGVSQTYALTQVAATEGLLVSINGVVQRPGVAYNVTNYPATTVANVLTLYESVSINDVIDVRYIASATSVTLTGLGEDISTTGNISANSLTLTSAIQFANLTTAQVNTISAPARGMTVYNYTSGNIQVYNGTKWANVVLS
jgi:hypothetical protein